MDNGRWTDRSKVESQRSKVRKEEARQAKKETVRQGFIIPLNDFRTDVLHGQEAVFRVPRDRYLETMRDNVGERAGNREERTGKDEKGAGKWGKG